MTVTAGTRLGPYEVHSQIGAGGMGEVWRATDTRLDRSVAIKILPEGFAQSEQFRTRFEREARTISSLNHPHICTLFDVGHESGAHYLVMELLEGESLADRLAKGPLPPDQVLKFGAQIADALDRAHKQGIVHRDLKPGNVMLTKSGAKLLDFGLARSSAESPAVHGLTQMPTQAKPLTQEGTILGTFQYMAPEQLEGLEADARTDIFALGALLYEMATGKRAFDGSTRTSLIAAIVSSHPAPISSVVPVAPPALDHIVKKCLEKDPDDRWQSAHDVASELRWISEAGSQAGVAAPVTLRRRSRERLAWGLAALFLITSGAIGAWALSRARSPERPFRTAVMPPDGVRIPLTDDAPGNSVPAPDGTKIVYRGVDGASRSTLYVHDLITGEARPLPETADAQYPFWSPDSRWVGFFTQATGGLMKIDTAGGSPVRITAALNGKGGSWNEAGQILFTRDYGSPISLVAAAGGEIRDVTRLDVKTHNSHRHPRFLPGGRQFLFLARSVQPGSMSSIMLASLDGGEPRELLKSDTQAEYAAGHILFVRGKTLMAQRFDPERGELEGEAHPLAEGAVTFKGAGYAAMGAASERFLVYHTTKEMPPRNLEWRDRKGGDAVTTIPVPGQVRNTALSPSRRFLAVSISSPDGETDIWIVDAEGGVSRRLPFPGEDLTPAWALDEKSIVFSSNPKGRFGLYRRAVDTNEPAQPVLEGKEDLFANEFLHDGRGLLVTRTDAGASAATAFDVLLLPTGSDQLSPMIDGAFAAALSPDGRKIAWLAAGDAGDLFVAAFPSLGDRRQVASGVANHFWSPTGSELCFVDRQDKLFSLDPASAAAPRAIESSGFPIGMSADGNRILAVAAPAEPPTSTIRMIQNWTQRPPGR